MNFTPHAYQRTVYDFVMRRLYAEGHKGAGVLLDPGLGKTAISLWVMRTLADLGEMRRCLIVAPLRVCYSVWPQEVRKWDAGFTCATIHGTPRQKRAALFDDNAELFLINPEGLDWLAKQGHCPFDTLWVDESTKFKNFTAKRTKRLAGLLPNFKRRVILTGTPSPNTMADLFAQIYLLDDGETLGNTLGFFRANYMYQGGYQGRVWKFNETRKKSLEDAIAPMVIRMDAADHLDLPRLHSYPLWVDLPPEQHQAYKRFERELFIALEDGESLTASSAGAAYASCRGIANGGVYIGEGRDRKATHVHDAKVDALVDIVDELNGKPVLVAYQFKHDLDRIRRAYPNAPAIAGGQKPAETDAVLKKWNAGKLRVLLAQPQAMSHGLNMQAGGNDIVWFGLTDQLEAYQQFNARLYRQGIKGQVRIHHLLARDTVDAAIYERLQDKAKGQKSLMDALKQYRHGEHAIAA